MWWEGYDPNMVVSHTQQVWAGTVKRPLGLSLDVDEMLGGCELKRRIQPSFIRVTVR